MFRKKTEPKVRFDPNEYVPVIRQSICTGEKAVGFSEIRTGRFREVMLLRTPKDLEAFRKEYGITGDIKTIY